MQPHQGGEDDVNEAHTPKIRAGPGGGEADVSCRVERYAPMNMREINSNRQ